jgi:hypothetical protein
MPFQAAGSVHARASARAWSGSDAHPGPLGDVLQWCIDALLNEHVPSRVEQPFPVEPRVDTHQPIMTGAVTGQPALGITAIADAVAGPKSGTRICGERG